MDPRPEIRDFLATRRAKIRPEQVGLPTGGRRRVPGLRREEVAVLAGVSTDWYTRLEKGHVAGVSEAVLDAVARALHLDDGERTYLFDLARAARPARRPRARAPQVLSPRLQWLLDSMTLSSAFVTDGHADVIASNALARVLHAPMFESSTAAVGRPNFARFIFLDPQAREFYVDWDAASRATTLCLRAAAGRTPDDPALQGLVGELSTHSEEFRGQWATHDVRVHSDLLKRLRHPEVGEVELGYQTIPLPPLPRGLAARDLYVYTAEPGSPSEDRLRVLSSWAATRTTQPASGGPA